MVEPVIGSLQPQSTTYNSIRQPTFAVLLTTTFCTIAGMKTPKFAARLRELRERIQTSDGALISQSDLARVIGVTPQAVQKWESGVAVPRPSKRSAIAHALSISARELVRGTELEEPADSPSPKDAGNGRVFPLRGVREVTPKTESGLLPLISWVQAATWGQKMGSIAADDVQDWLRCPFDHGPNAFVLEIAGESNFDPTGPKSYAPGELIYVDPQREPVNRSMVVVRLDSEERAQLKQLLMDEGGTRLLKSLNPNWPMPVSVFPDHATVVGVVIGKWTPE